MRLYVRSSGKIIDLTPPSPPRAPHTSELIPQPRQESRYEFEYRESTQIASALLYALPLAFVIDIIAIYLIWKAIHIF